LSRAPSEEFLTGAKPRFISSTEVQSVVAGVEGRAVSQRFATALIKDLNIPELQYERTNKARGFKWTPVVDKE
jgi:hypothetical protein